MIFKQGKGVGEGAYKKIWGGDGGYLNEVTQLKHELFLLFSV